MNNDKYLALSGETLLEMLHDLELSEATQENEIVAEAITEVEAEISRRCRGGLSSLHALMGHLLQNSDITYID